MTIPWVIASALADANSAIDATVIDILADSIDFLNYGTRGGIFTCKWS